MPGIDPPRLARLQEIPVCEKCCGLEHLFSFHSGMKPRLSGRRGRGGEKKKKNYFFFFFLFFSWVVVVEEGQPHTVQMPTPQGWGVSPLPTASHFHPLLL